MAEKRSASRRPVFLLCRWILFVSGATVMFLSIINIKRVFHNHEITEENHVGDLDVKHLATFLSREPDALRLQRLAPRPLRRIDAFHDVMNRTYKCEIDGKNMSLPFAPDFIIIGAEKGGTTALMKLLPQHPNILASNEPEPHFFDNQRFKMNGKMGQELEPQYIDMGNGATRSVTDITTEELCTVRKRQAEGWPKEFVRLARLSGKSLLTFEKCPSYMIYASVPKWVHTLCPWEPKIIASLRNPVDRAYSQYQMLRRRVPEQNLTDFPSFEAILTKEIEELRSLGLTTAPGLETFSPRIHDESHFVIPKNLTWEMRINVPINVKLLTISRGFYAQQLQPWLEYFPLHESLMVIDFEAVLHRQMPTLNRIYKFVGAEPLSRIPTAKKATHEVTDLNPSTQEYLRRFYKPYNDELADLLGEKWRSLWY